MTRGAGNWPGPRPELIASVSERLRAHSRWSSSRGRLAFALAISTVLLAAIAAVGGVGAAATSLIGNSPRGTAAHDQYTEEGFYCTAKVQKKKTQYKLQFGTPPFKGGFEPIFFYGSTPGPCPPA